MDGALAAVVASRRASARGVATALLASLVSARAAHALDPAKAITQYVHHAWLTETGLPATGINDIAQGPDGYLWLANEVGVVRFDGVAFKTYDRRNLPQMVNDRLVSILVDRSGAVWAGTTRGLVRLANGVVTRYTSAEGFSEDLVRCLFEDAEGSLWAGTEKDGLYRYRDGRFTKFKKEDGLVSNAIRAILTDHAGALWIGTAAGLQRLKDGVFATWTTRQGLAHDYVGALHEDREGRLWIGTFSGLHRMTGSRLETWTTRDGLSHDLISDIEEDDHGTIWIATYGGGLNRYANGRFLSFTSREGLSNDFLSHLLFDQDGTLWIGGVGLDQLKDGVVTTYGTREGLSHDVVTAVYEDPTGVLWTGTHGGGLNRFDGQGFAVLRKRDGLLSDVVFALRSDGKGGLWIGCYDGGLNRLRHGRISAHHDPALPRTIFINAIVRDRSGTVWLGTFGGGLKRLDANGLRSLTSSDGLSHNVVWSLLEDRSGSMWAGTRLGLNRITDGVPSRFTTAEGLPNDVVWALHEDDDGTLWVGTDGGLAHFRDGRFASFGVGHGLFDDRIVQILEDGEGRLWMGTPRGIFRVAKRELEEVAQGTRRVVTSFSYGIEDGLRTVDCNRGTQPAAWKSRDGRLWFTTSKGLAVVDPRKVVDETKAPPVLVEEALVDGNPLGSDPAETGPESRQFEFRYTALHLRAPERLRFRYRLDGVDEDWIDAGERRVAYYTNLPPGRRVFRVSASAGGPWSEPGARLEFRVRPHFYQTAWFFALCALAVGLAGYTGHRYRMRRLLEIVRVRMRIASDLHDDIGSTLSQIAILSEVARAQIAQGAEKAAEPIARIGALSRESLDSMGDIVWAIDPQKDRLAHLSQRMRRLTADLLGASGVRFRFETVGEETDGHLGADLRREVFLVFKESLNNAVRHSGCTEVAIDLRLEGSRLLLTVADDGDGFDPGGQREGQGLRSMRRRAESLGGTLEVVSREGGGTKVVLTVPY
jgi:ligand-binding sensor domain-containing protein/two-component sensor histidine kinase